MANIHSQKKRILRSERERLENRRYTSAIKTHFRSLTAAVEGGEGDAAQTHRELVSTIDKAVKRGALHRNTGARKKSRAAKLLARSPSARRRRLSARDRSPIARVRRRACPRPFPPARPGRRLSTAPPRVSSSSRASTPIAPRSRAGSLRCTSAIRRSAAFGGIRSPFLTSAAERPAASCSETATASRNREASR